MNIKKYFPWKCQIKIPASCCYKPPNGDHDILSIVLNHVFKKSTVEKKLCYLIRDHNINCLKYFENKKVSTFYISLFQYGAIASKNKPTRVVKNRPLKFTMSSPQIFAMSL